MPPETDPQVRSQCWPPGPGWALVGILLAGFAIRAMAGLAPDCIPGDDGAYYFVQVRSLLRGQGLPIPDFPLLFHVLALLARALSVWMDAREAVVAAVRWTDTLVPLGLAFPVYRFTCAFTLDPRRAATSVVVVGLLAVASGNALVMTGGMIKNGVALPGCLFFAWALHRGLSAGNRRMLLWAAFWGLLSSLVHLSALVFNGVFTALYLMFGSPYRLRWRVVLLTAVLAGCLGVALVLDPERGRRLMDTVLRPSGALSLPTSQLWDYPQVGVSIALGMAGVLALWRHRRTLVPAERALLVVSTLTTLALAFPFLRPELLERLALVAFVSGLIPAAFLVSRDALGPLIVAPVVAFSLLHGALAVKTLRVTGLVRPALEDLEILQGGLPPGRTLVLTPHRLGWWASWTLDRPFCNWAERALKEREAWDSLLLLEQTRPGAFGQSPVSPTTFPGSTLRDGDALCGERLTLLKEGKYFRLSLIQPHVPSKHGSAPPGS